MEKIINQISTHKAVKNGNKIDIILKGISIPVGYKYPNGDVEKEGFFMADEFLYSIPAENEDDLFSIFESLEEENRINVAEFKGSFEYSAPMLLERDEFGNIK